MALALPNNDRYVLTWVRDAGECEYWQIDTYCHKTVRWEEAFSWEQKVLFWQELPPKPNLEAVATGAQQTHGVK